MELADERWNGLRGGYGVPYDPRPALNSIHEGVNPETAWAELWNELHHQGDVGEVSYASIPVIAELVQARPLDWNGYALAATIEECRSSKGNPPLSPWLAEAYEAAWQTLFEIGLGTLSAADDETLVSSIIAVLATRKRQPMLARLAMISESERSDMLEEVGWA